ncbi:cytochrome D1 domain-containing protein [Marivita sp. S0852]|uniref:cytochrome D1 domain-containing protein n=1 Tax=Marivita sp. S0852 TaxID=3373893 RepID=UPI003981A8B3
MIRRIFSASLLALLPIVAQSDPAVTYATHCAVCHGDDRLGGLGPALIPESLRRLKGDDLIAVIGKGRISTQMPGFDDQITPDDMAELAAFLHTPLPDIPVWDADRIAETLEVNPDYVAPDAPQHNADPLNIFVVVETGDHHISIVDGDRFEVLARLPTPLAVHGGPKFSPDGRYVFVMSRDGWVQKIDLWSMKEVARLRAGVNSRNIAMSKDGKFLAVANYLPHSLTILSTEDLSVQKIFDVIGKEGESSRVSAVYQAPQRNSFILALKDIPEIWEVATDPNAEPVYEGFVHSHEKDMVEGIPSSQGLFARKRIELEEPLDDFFFTPDYRFLIGAARESENGVVVNLNVGRPTHELPLSGLPHLGSGISWIYQGRRVMATPHLREAKLSVIDVETWQIVTQIDTMGPGFFLRSHENSQYLWADVFFGPNRDVMHVIDKDTLEIVKTLRPAPGQTAAHVEFDRTGEHALVSLWEEDGAVIVYDAATLEEVKRLPMSKPSGKYNVHNKITFSDGTSH